jgi:hypothetical protein
VKTVDVHAHRAVPEAMALMGRKVETPALLMSSWLKGNGGLGNVIGNPLETAIALSHLIFEGTLDRFPGLKICAAHGAVTCPRTRRVPMPGA